VQDAEDGSFFMDVRDMRVHVVGYPYLDRM